MEMMNIKIFSSLPPSWMSLRLGMLRGQGLREWGMHKSLLGA